MSSESPYGQRHSIDRLMAFIDQLKSSRVLSTDFIEKIKDLKHKFPRKEYFNFEIYNNWVTSFFTDVVTGKFSSHCGDSDNPSYTNSFEIEIAVLKIMLQRYNRAMDIIEGFTNAKNETEAVSIAQYIEIMEKKKAAQIRDEKEEFKRLYAEAEEAKRNPQTLINGVFILTKDLQILSKLPYPFNPTFPYGDNHSVNRFYSFIDKCVDYSIPPHKMTCEFYWGFSHLKKDFLSSTNPTDLTNLFLDILGGKFSWDIDESWDIPAFTSAMRAFNLYTNAVENGEKETEERQRKIYF